MVRTFLDDSGEPWWVAKDVCDVLGLRDTNRSLAKLDEGEKGITSSYTLGGAQEMITVNEPGLYRLIMRSRKPRAVAFQKWIAHEVLPAVRILRFDSEPPKCHHGMIGE